MNKERPILFSGPMVKAILDGRKTQTRRVIKPQPEVREDGSIWLYRSANRYEGYADYRPGIVSARAIQEYCPYGQPGDGLWVRETWAAPRHTAFSAMHKQVDLDSLCPSELPSDTPLIYKASRDKGPHSGKWRPSIHMPRWASRITLEVTDVRVERVQDISVEDIIAEGLSTTLREHDACCHLRDQWVGLWDSINAAPKPVKVGGRIDHYVSYPWDDIHETRTHRGLPWLVIGNPWVWCVTFKRVTP